jgi:hypothetical protein
MIQPIRRVDPGLRFIYLQSPQKALEQLTAHPLTQYHPPGDGRGTQAPNGTSSAWTPDPAPVPLMVSIGKMGAGQEGYYLGKVAEGAEDYYSGEGEAEGYWLGDSAEDLGLHGKVDPDQLVAMLTGRDPASGDPLGLQPRLQQRPGPRLRPHLLGAEVGLADLGARRPPRRLRGQSRPRRFRQGDPSMTREEFYVATSRTRGETFLYATPEVQLHREEIAPASPFLRSGLEHIAEATERIGAQAAAHDEALRSRYAEHSPSELVARLRELASEAGADQRNEDRRARLEDALDHDGELLEQTRVKLGSEVAPAKRRWLEQTLTATRGRIEGDREHLQTMAPVVHKARAEAAVIESVLSDRERLTAAAARISPPDYLTRELGERPGDPAEAAAWERAMRGIERYRLRNGVVDGDNALGEKPRDRVRAQEHEQAKRQVERAIPRRSARFDIAAAGRLAPPGSAAPAKAPTSSASPCWATRLSGE